MTPTKNSFPERVAVDRHIGDDRLVDLALADEQRDDETTHLAGCPRCTQALSSLRRTVEVARDSAGTDLVDPPSQVWTRIQDELDVAKSPAPSSAQAADDVVVPLRRAGARRSDRARRPALGWLAAACAAGVFLGAGGLLAADRLGADDVDQGRTVATAQLDTLDTGQRLGTASVSEQGGGVVLDVSATQIDAAADGYVEVWLINRDGKRLVSVGVLGDNATSGSFPISQRLLDEGYVVVDLSREQFDDKPQHSGDSLVRGSLTTPA